MYISLRQDKGYNLNFFKKYLEINWLTSTLKVAEPLTLLISKAYIPLRRKTLHVGVWRWGTPPTREFCIKYTNMLVSKDAKTSICATPNTKPQREPMEYRWHWVPNARGQRWPCRFHVVCTPFSTLAMRKLANANAISSGMQA